MDNDKLMYDAWMEDILDDVRDNVVGEYYHNYLNKKFYREILKDLLHRTKLVYEHKYPSKGPVAHFNYDGGYELESPSNTINHIEKYLVPENELNDLHNVYYFILKKIVNTQGEENILTESNDKLKEYLDKVVDRLLKESEYRIWTHSQYDYIRTKINSQYLKKIRAEIKFGLVNTWREGESEYFDMYQVQNNSLRNEPRKYEYLEDYERDQLKNIYGLTDDEMVKVVYKYYTKLYNNIYKSYLEMDEDNKVPTSEPEKWFRGDEVFEIGGRLNESLSSRVNKDVDDLFKDDSTLKGEENIKNKFKKLFGMDDWVADHAMVLYLSKQQSLNESVDWDKIGKVIRDPDKSKHIYTLLVGMFPNAKEVIDYNYYGDNEEPNPNDTFAEMKGFLWDIDKNIIKGPTLELASQFKIENEYKQDLEQHYNDYVEGKLDKFFRESPNDPRDITPEQYENMPPIMVMDGGVIDGNHRAFLAQKAGAKLPTFEIVSTPNTHPNAKKILSIIHPNDKDRDGIPNRLDISQQPNLNESDRQGRFLDRIIEQLVKETIIYPSEGMISLPNEPDDKYNARKIFDPKDYFYNRFLSNIIHHSRDFYGLSDEEIDYVWKNYFYEIKTNYYYLKELNESTEKPKGFNLKYLFKVADSIIKEIEISNDNFKSRGFGAWSEMSTGGRGFWVGLEKHAKDIYGLTQGETEMVSGIVWDSLNAKNILVYKVTPENRFRSLREQHYEDWDERSREQNINLLKTKGITILSTDSNVPFFKRIDSKEIRYLKNVVDRLDKESKIEVIGGDYAIEDEDFLLITPFGKFDFTDFMREYSNRRFEKYINDIYAVGDNQIMFPTHNSISQIGENYFLWGMYKDKLKRKYLKLVNPGLPDIPDEAIIIENDLTSDEHKSLLQSFEVMDTPEEIASEELGNMIKWVKTLPEELFLYRVLYLNEVNDINYEELGSHYSQDRTDLINNHYDRGSIYGDMGEHAYLITVKVPKSEVDVMETLNNNILYPHEKEITLKDKGRGAQYLDIEKI